MGKPKGKQSKAVVQGSGPVVKKPGSSIKLPSSKKMKPPKPIKQVGPALALSGGAAQGDFEVGVVRYLYEHGLVPKIICGTSVGAINALKLAEGEPDGAAKPDADGHIQGLAGLIAIWKALRVNEDMYTLLAPAAKLEKDLEGLGSSLKSSAVAGGLLGGSFFGPLGALGGASTAAVISALTHKSELLNDFAKLLTTRCLANLDPLAKRMRMPTSFKESLVEKSEIMLRMVMTALEDGAARLVDEHGTLRERDDTRTSGKPKYDAKGQAIEAQIKQLQQDIKNAQDAALREDPHHDPKDTLPSVLDDQRQIGELRAQLAKHVIGDKQVKVGLIEAALASSSLPVFFPPQPLADGRNYVDGGTRMVTPIETAWRVGASAVYAVVAYADTMSPGSDPFKHVDLPSYAPPANIVDIAMRVGGEIEPSEINDSQLLPPNGWPVTVIIFRPNHDIHDPMTIDPGLIDIRMDQGWMCGDDVMQAWARDSVNYLAVANQLDDERGTTLIAKYRHTIWIAEFAANGLKYNHDGTGAPTMPGPLSPLDLGNVPTYIENVRAMKQQLQQLVAKRQAAGGNVPSGAERWWTDWERHSWTPAGPLFPLAKMSVQASPSVGVPLNKRTTIEVTATSSGKPVPGASVFVNGKRIGPTGKPITTTFVGSRVVVEPGTHQHHTVFATPSVVVEAHGFVTTPVPIQFSTGDAP